MIVHPPTISIADGSACVAARLEMAKPLPDMPQELWYRFPEKYFPYLSPRTEAFAATALLVAMYAGEDLDLHGPISPWLAYNLIEYRNVFHSWLPNLFQLVDINYNRIETFQPEKPTASAVAMAFSGGVDSFYTLWAHRPENQPIPDAQVTHGLFVFGLDLRQGDEHNYNTAAELYIQLFKSLGLELILASTNAYQFSQYRINWTLFHGPPLIGAALLLSPLLRRFYIASSMPTFGKLVPQGNHPLTDHLLSTETLEFVHHGATASRYDKVKAIAKWAPTYHHLRVCARKKLKEGVHNCGSCHKCIRTMVLFEILGVTERYSQNFQKILFPSSYFRWGLLHPLDPYHAGLVRQKAIATRRFGIAFWVQIAIFLRITKKFIEGLLKRILGREGVYRLKKRIYQRRI